MWYIYSAEYYFAIKNNKIMPFAAIRMYLEIITVSEVREKYEFINMWNIIKKIQKNLFTKWKQTDRF